MWNARTNVACCVRLTLGMSVLCFVARGAVGACCPQWWRQVQGRLGARVQPWGLPSATEFSSSLTSPETFVSEILVHVSLVNCYQEGNAAIIYLLFLLAVTRRHRGEEVVPVGAAPQERRVLGPWGLEGAALLRG